MFLAPGNRLHPRFIDNRHKHRPACPYHLRYGVVLYVGRRREVADLPEPGEVRIAVRPSDTAGAPVFFKDVEDAIVAEGTYRELGYLLEGRRVVQGADESQPRVCKEAYAITVASRQRRRIDFLMHEDKALCDWGRFYHRLVRVSS